MSEILNILMLEDEARDFLLVEEEFRKQDLPARLTRVETKEDFQKGLESQPDVILSDHGLPSFEGLSALRLVRLRSQHIPFIFVTGALGEQSIIEAHKEGATDYVLKQHLSDLVPTVRRALLKQELRKKEKEELERLRKKERARQIYPLLQKLPELIPVCSGCKKIRDAEGVWLEMEHYFQSLLTFSFTHGICPCCVKGFQKELEAYRRS